MGKKIEKEKIYREGGVEKMEMDTRGNSKTGQKEVNVNCSFQKRPFSLATQRRDARFIIYKNVAGFLAVAHGK